MVAHKKNGFYPWIKSQSFHSLYSTLSSLCTTMRIVALVLLISLPLGGYLLFNHGKTQATHQQVATSASSQPTFPYHRIPQMDIYPNGVPYPTMDLNGVENAEQIKKGEYLVKIGDCISCHTNTNLHDAPPFAGGYSLSVPPFGTFYTPNITGDKETGIGNWSDEQFLQALRRGMAPHWRNLFPVFPYIYFNRISDDDALAIKAYLMHIPAINNAPPKDEILWPFSMRWLQLGWKLLFFYPYAGEIVDDPQQSAAWNRGRYIVDGLAHCSMCHTPVNMFGAPKRWLYLGGAAVDNFYAPNITSAVLANYTIDEIMQVMQQGVFLGGQGKVLGPMSEANHNSFMQMSDDDIRAIATYIKTVPPIAPSVAGSDATGWWAATDIYNHVCSGCHAQSLLGAPIIGQQANWEDRLQRAGSIEQLVYNAIHGINNMPPMGTCETCSKEQIRDTVLYMLDRSLPNFYDSNNMIVPTAPPETPSQPLPQANTAFVVEKVCATCHHDNPDGILSLNDKQAWQPILQQDPKITIMHTLQGYRGMPAKGGCDWCSNEQVIDAVKYMLNTVSDEKDYSLW